MSRIFKVPSLDYTSRDFAAIRDDAIARINFFIEEWTDQSEGDPGVVIIELFAGMHDVLHWYIDRGLREGFVTDVLGRRSMIALAALLGQRLKGKAPSASSVDITIQTTEILPVPVLIGTKLTTAGLTPSVPFEVNQAAVIPAGLLTVTGVPVINGETRTGALGQSDGREFQAFLLADIDNVLDEGIKIYVAGSEWDYIDSLIMAGPTDEVWTYTRDVTGRVYIVFGNGTVNGGNGFIPAESDEVTASWREGGGINTSVGKNYIRVVVSQLFAGSNPVSASCTNPEEAIGGDEQESVDVARRRIPRAHRANDRVVIRNDAEAVAESVPGVVQSFALVTGIADWTVYVAPHPAVGVGTGTDPFGYTILTSRELSLLSFSQLVTSTLQAKRMGTDAIHAQLAWFRPVDSAFTVTLAEGTNRARFESDLSVFISGYFDVRNRSIGEPGKNIADASYSDWFSGIAAIDGVDELDMGSFQLRPQIQTVQAIGEPQFDSIEYTSNTQHAFWEILFLDQSTYAVYRQALDSELKILQPDLGVLGRGYVAPNNEIKFSISLPSGNVDPHSGDTYRFRASPIRDTVPILTGEIAVQGQINYSLIAGV